MSYKLTHTRAVVGSDLSTPDDQEHQPFVRMEKPSFERLMRTFKIQAAFAIMFFFAFLLYLPIGLAIIQPFKRLTISKVSMRLQPEPSIYSVIDPNVRFLVPAEESRDGLLHQDHEVQCHGHQALELWCVLSTAFLLHSADHWTFALEDDLTANQIRSASQVACILSLVGYSLSFTMHDFDG